MSDVDVFLAMIPAIFVGFVLAGKRPSSALLVFSVLLSWLASGVFNLVAMVMS